MSSEDWIVLDDASKLVAVACMLIASRYEGRVPELTTCIARIQDQVDLAPLVDCRVLVNASAVPKSFCRRFY